MGHAGSRYHIILYVDPSPKSDKSNWRICTDQKMHLNRIMRLCQVRFIEVLSLAPTGARSFFRLLTIPLELLAQPAELPDWLTAWPHASTVHQRRDVNS